MAEVLKRRWYALLAPLIAIAALVAALAPGSAAAAGGTGTITGTITNTGGTDLAGVSVTLENAEGVAVSGVTAATTTASGVYTLTGVPAGGSYYLYINPTADSNGVPYAPMYYGTTAGAANSQTESAGTPVTVASGATATETTTAVTTGGEITGTVKDATTGDPLTGDGLELVDSSGTPVDAPVDTTSPTTGVYTFAGLLPGTYSIEVFGTVGATAGSEGDEYTNITTGDPVADASGAFDGTTGLTVSQQTGTGFSLTTGQTTPTTSNIALPTATSISGTVTNGGNGEYDVAVNLYDTSGNPLDAGSGNQLTSTTGTYTIGGLLPGSYKVGFNTGDEGAGNLAYQYYNNASTLAAATAVTPGTTASTGINAALVAGGTITGTVDNTAKAGVANVTVELEDASGNVLASALTNQSGTYTLTGIPAGTTYHVEFIPDDLNAANTYQDQYYFGSQTLGSSNAVSVTAGATTANIDAVLEPVTTGSATTTVTTTTAAATPTITAGTPTISGTDKVGDTLKVSPGTWTAGTLFSYQWYADGVAIPGATSSSYKLAAGQYKKTIAVAVVGAESGYYSAGAVSASTGAVTAGTLKTVVPKLSGTVKVGGKLAAKTGTWTSGTKFTYQWYANGKKIKGATKSTFKLAKAEKGKKVEVKVTGKLTGYTTVTKTSKATKKVPS